MKPRACFAVVSWVAVVGLAVSCNTVRHSASGPESPRAPSGGEAEAAPTSAVQPDALFPPEGIDHLAMQVAVDFEIFAIGKDRVDMKGSVVVHRSGPQGPEGKLMTGDLVGAHLRGTSDVFGEVIATRSPIQHSPCEYTWEGPGRYVGHFDIQGWFWLPKHDLLAFTLDPVRVRGTADAIPPVGERAEKVGDDVALYDFRNPTGNPIGAVTGAQGHIPALVSLEEHLASPSTTVPALIKP